MSTLDELRRTMDQHADDIHDDAVHVRAAVVRRRGQQVRRQRRAGAGLATVAAAAAVVALVTLPSGHSPQPADRRLLGMEAPATMTSLGYTYDFARGIEGDATRTTVKLSASEDARLLTWADRGDGTIRIRTADDRTIVSRGDFTDFVAIPPGASGTWTVEGPDTAAAVYQVDATRPPKGFTRAGITYRAQVLDRQLLTADIGQAGQADLQGRVTLPAGRVGSGAFCTGGTSKTWIHVEVADAPGSFGQNCTAPVFDPGGNLESGFRTPGQTSTVHVWATEGEHGPLSTSPSLRLGYGFYALGHETIRVAGYRLEQQVEYDGHVWGLSSYSQGKRGAQRQDFQLDGDTPTLVTAAFSHTGGPVHTRLGGESGAAFSGSGLGGSTVLGVWKPGTSGPSLRIRGTVSPRALLGFAFYQRLD